MKHIQPVTQENVAKAQMSTTQIITLVATIMSALAGLMATIAPLIGGK